MEGTVASLVVKSEDDRVKVKRKTLQAVLEQCQKALESLSEEDPCVDDDDGGDEDGDGDQERGQGSSSGCGDDDELCHLLRSRVECLDFLEKLETQHLVDEYSSWDMVSKNDLWDGDLENLDLDEYICSSGARRYSGWYCLLHGSISALYQTDKGRNS